MKNYELKTEMLVGQVMMGKVFNYVLKEGEILEYNFSAYITKNNIWFDKETVENNPKYFKPCD